MLCEKCQQLNDAMCVKCINCGNTLIEITQKDHAEHPNKEKYGPMHSIIVVAGIFIPYQIFEYFADDLFQPSVGSLNYARIMCAAIVGAVGALIGGKIADHVLGKK